MQAVVAMDAKGETLKPVMGYARGMPLLGFETGTTQVRFVAFSRNGLHLAFGSEPGGMNPVVAEH